MLNPMSVGTAYGKYFTFKPVARGPSQHAPGNQVMQNEFILTSEVPVVLDSPSTVQKSRLFPEHMTDLYHPKTSFRTWGPLPGHKGTGRCQLLYQDVT